MPEQETPEGLRCDGSHACPAQRHVYGCFRSTLADDVEGHPNWQENPEGLGCPTCGGAEVIRDEELDEAGVVVGVVWEPCPDCYPPVTDKEET